MKTGLRITLWLALLILPGLATAHPMGNFSINHHSTIHVSSDVISITTFKRVYEANGVAMDAEIQQMAAKAGIKL
jgi:hypothetical protein